MNTETARNNSNSVRRALEIVEYISTHSNINGVSLEEITSGTNFNRSTVLRLMMPLLDVGLVGRNQETGRYYVGTKSLQWAQASLAGWNIHRLATPVLHQLMEFSGETVYLASYESGTIVYIDKVESQNTIRMVAQIGIRLPAYATATGKAILAFRPKAEVEKVIQSGLQPRTPRTITTRDELLRELQAIGVRGYSIDSEEHEIGVSSVAAPIIDRQARAVAAISIAGPTYRFPIDRAHELGMVLKKACATVSQTLGFFGNE